MLRPFAGAALIGALGLAFAAAVATAQPDTEFHRAP
jgi:hypothetical protein